MKGIEDFATGGTSSGQIRWEPYLEKAIEQYLESNSKLRQFCFIYKLQGTYTANLPKSASTGYAVEIVEGTEIPAVRQVITTVDVKVSANGTAIEMTDEAKKLDWYGDLAAREVEEATKRMLRKENYDIANILMSAAATETDSLNEGYLDVNDIIDAKTYLRKQQLEPDTVLVNPDQFGDLIKSGKLQEVSKSGSTSPLREGTLGGRIAGLNVVEIPEITSGAALVADFSSNPLWLVILQELEVEAFRIPDRRMEKVQMTNYEKPAVLKSEAIRQINITQKSGP